MLKIDLARFRTQVFPTLSVHGTPTLPKGIYRCDIETSATTNDSRESAYVGLYQHNNTGQYMWFRMFTACGLPNGTCGVAG